MTSRLFRPALSALLIFAAWISAQEMEQVAAASPKAKEESEGRARSTMPEYQFASPRSVKSRTTHTFKKETDRPMTAEFRRKKSSSRPTPHSRFRKKTLNPPPPPEQAQLKPDPDLSYHGILENSRRYDPSPVQRRGAVLNPQAHDLRFDHFQELDKNQDGVIDPLERATSRLDIDRDLSSRQRE